MKQMSLLLGVERSFKKTSLLSAFLKLLSSHCSCPTPKTAVRTFRKVPVAVFWVQGASSILGNMAMFVK